MGALCLETFDLQLIETLKMSTQTTIDLLARLERHNPGRTGHPSILTGRQSIAAGLSGTGWRTAAASDCISCPPTLPNLNAIERLWKVMHEHVTHNRYYANFRAFAEAIMRFFSQPCRKTGNRCATRSTTISTSSAPTISAYRVDGGSLFSD